MKRLRVIAALLLAALLSSQVASAATLVGYWTLDETGTTGTLADSAGANPATITGSLGNTTPPAAVTFSTNAKGSFTTGNRASSSGYVGLPSCTAAISISLWMKPDTGFSDVAPIGLGSSTNVIWFNIYSNAFIVNYWGGTIISASPTFTAGTWYHLAYTYDGTTDVLYVNGTQVASSTGNSRNAGVPASVNIGYFPGFSNQFVGWLDDVRIYSGALTSGEVTTLAGGGAVPPLGGTSFNACFFGGGP